MAKRETDGEVRGRCTEEFRDQWQVERLVREVRVSVRGVVAAYREDFLHEVSDRWRG